MPMISAATAHTSLAHAYDRNAVATAFRSQPVQRVAATTVGDDAASEPREDKATLSTAGLDRSGEDGGKEAAANHPEDANGPARRYRPGDCDLRIAYIQMVY